MNSEDLVAWRRQRGPLDDPLSNFDVALVESNDRQASHAISEAIKNGDPNYEIHVEYEFDNEGGERISLGPRMWPRSKGAWNRCARLLRLGADVNARDRGKRRTRLLTPLHYATRYGRAHCGNISAGRRR